MQLEVVFVSTVYTITPISSRINFLLLNKTIREFSKHGRSESPQRPSSVNRPWSLFNLYNTAQLSKHITINKKNPASDEKN